MKTFYELGTLPKVGDLVIRMDTWDHPLVLMITNIVGRMYHTSKAGHSMHRDHLRIYYSPLVSETVKKV
jgi:hypothetical protein